MQGETQISHQGLTFVPYITEQEIQTQVKRVAAEISNEYREKHPLFIGILNGAFVFTSDLIRNLDFMELQIEFCKVSSYSGTSSQGSLKQLIGLKSSIKGRHVIIVEDMVDSGVTMKGIIEYLNSQEPASIKLCAMFIKPDCIKVDLKVDFVGISSRPEFMVGYGLDFNEWGRNIPSVWHLKPKDEASTE